MILPVKAAPLLNSDDCKGLADCPDGVGATNVKKGSAGMKVTQFVVDIGKLQSTGQVLY
ncbi:hypothetical protein NBRC116188_16170 [Oceaniserpentilla sp. 4NH20-0058]